MYKRFLRFIFCVVGIYYCYLKLGIVNEGIYKTNHGTIENPSPQFSYGCSVILLQMILLWGLSQIVMIVRKQEMVCTFREGFNLGSLNFLSMYGALTALQYVSFPLQAITKSCNFELFLCSLLGYLQAKQHLQDSNQFVGSQLQVGSFFSISRNLHILRKKVPFLGFVYQFYPYFVMDYWLHYKQNINQLNILINGKCKFILQELEQWLLFLLEQKILLVLPSILEISILGVVGQLFIFYCIKIFSPRVLSIVTTSRKFFTIMFSIFINGHHISHFQWVAISLVAIGLAWELKMGMKHKHPHPHPHPHKETKPSSEEISYQKVIGKEI